MDQVLAAYFAAWNEPDAEERSRLLELAVTDDAELIDPTGRWQGIDGQSSTPTTVTSWRASTSPSEPTIMFHGPLPDGA